MTAPRGLIGASLIVWGFCVGMPAIGILLGLAIEAARWPRPPAVLARRASLLVRAAGVAGLASLAYFAATTPMPQGLYVWLRILPMILVPFALTGPAIGAPVYAAITLVAAGTGHAFPAAFYPAAAAVLAWALLANKPFRGISLVPSVMLAIAIAVGFGVHQGLSALQGQVEQLGTDMLQDFFAPKADPFRERTRMGDLGRVKLSDRIVMRVAFPGPMPTSLLLREAAFDRYSNGEWRTSQRAFKPAAREGDRWVLGSGPGDHAIGVRTSISGGEGLLSLPAGSRTVGDLPAGAVETLPSGAVRARGVPHFVSMAITYDEQAERAPPGEFDLEVPPLVAPLLDQVLAAERLDRGSPRGTLEAIERFFNAKFSYSLALSSQRDGAGRTLADFLLRDRKGHCEYFATATALLLRRAGIPARYTVGYSAQEPSAVERAFVVRSRHAHAWVSAFIDGAWTTVDTTPARWAESEGEEARGFFGPMLDLGSWLADRAIQAWMQSSPAAIARVAVITLAAALVLAATLAGLRRRRRRQPRPDAGNPVARAWLALEKRLARAGLARPTGETVLAWARRLREVEPSEAWREDLVGLAHFYYRARYDPACTSETQHAFLDAARRWRGPR